MSFFLLTIVQRIVLYSVIHGCLFSMERFALCNILLYSSDILFDRIWILNICVCIVYTCNLFQSLSASGEDSVTELNPRLLPGMKNSIIFKHNGMPVFLKLWNVVWD